MNTKYDRLAAALMFAGKADLQVLGLEYRKGKTIEDVKKARLKALDPKNGMAKTEVELSMFAVYLKGIFKECKVSGPYAITITGPSGLQSYMDAQGRRARFEDRQQFATAEQAVDEMDGTKGEFLRRIGFVVSVVNVEDPEESL